MKLSQLIMYVAFAIVGFWLLGLVIKLAAWVIDIVLVVVLVLVIVWLVSRYFESKKKPKI